MHTWFGDVRAGTTNDPVRHRLADAARAYDWARVLAILEGRRDCVNSCRPGGSARFTPLHQAAHGAAPKAVVRRLVAMGAWRTIRNARGERPVDVARRRGHCDLIPRLSPRCRRHVAPGALARLERHFHCAIRQRVPRLVAPLRLPQLEPLLEMGCDAQRDRVISPCRGCTAASSTGWPMTAIVPDSSLTRGLESLMATRGTKSLREVGRSWESSIRQPQMWFRNASRPAERGERCRRVRSCTYVPTTEVLPVADMPQGCPRE